MRRARWILTALAVAGLLAAVPASAFYKFSADDGSATPDTLDLGKRYVVVQAMCVSGASLAGTVDFFRDHPDSGSSSRAAYFMSSWDIPYPGYPGVPVDNGRAPTQYVVINKTVPSAWIIYYSD